MENWENQEFNTSQHEYSRPLDSEFGFPTEVDTEFLKGAKPEDEVDLNVARRQKSKERSLLMKAAAAMATIVIALDSFGIDPLGLDVFAKDSPIAEIVDGEAADIGFPMLQNLQPNGYINDQYGVLDEDYIIIVSPSSATKYYPHVNDKFDDLDLPKHPQATYDAATNTLTLDNIESGSLECNLMGNGFKINVIGDCKFETIHVWGFHYGGSLTITGSGTLTVGSGYVKQYGIYLRSEESNSCLMIDKDVTVEAYGSRGAVYVEDSTALKGIYYLSPLKLSEGKRAESVENNLHYYFIEDEEGNMARHVKFSRE